jgi:ATP-dependent helicase/nuclease subunit A
MSIIKRTTKKKGVQYDVNTVKYIDGVRYRYNKTFNTREEAKKGEREFLSNLDKGIKPTSNISFVEYGQRYIDSLDGISPRTKHSYQQKFEYLKPHFKGKIKSFNNDDIKEALKTIKAEHNLSNRSMNHIFKIMKRIFQQAHLNNLIEKDMSGTFLKTTGYRIDKVKPKVLTLDEQNRFIKYLSDRQDKKLKDNSFSLFAKQEYIFGLVALATGMRRGELSALSWENIDLDAKTINVKLAVSYCNKQEVLGKPKTHAGIRLVALDDFTCSELRKYKLFLRTYFMSASLNSWIFPKHDGLTRTPVTSWCQRISKVFKALDIKHSLHSLRHTHASNMLTNNYPLIQLSHRLGHADPSITLSIYAKVVKGLENDVNQYIPNLNLKQVNK